MIVNFIFSLMLKIILSDSYCKNGLNNCELCNPLTNICIKCENNVFIPNKNGGCEGAKNCILGKNFCIKCSNEGKLCEKCEEGYFPDENGGCSFSLNCEISFRGKCLKCKEKYILNEQLKICKSIYSEDFKNCEIVQTYDGSCEKCKEGYYLSSEDKRCTKTENCKESIFETCIECKNGYYLNKKEGKCILQKNDLLNCKEVLDGENCSECEDGYYFDEDNKCVDTINCKKRNEFGNCENCTLGYFLSEFDKTCTKTEKCYTGLKDVGICESCKVGFYIDYNDGKCKSNRENNDFKYCREARDKCNECMKDYYLGEDYLCTDNKYCAESRNGICIECKNNYYLGLDNRCSNVEHCIYSNEYECTECEDNYYYDRYLKKCKKWEKNFENCKYGNEVNGCERCKDNFYLNQTDRLCYNNLNGSLLYKCAITDVYGTYCLFCIDNYYLSGILNKCSKVKGCEIFEDEDRCLKCNPYHCLDVKTGLCEDNDQIKWKNKTFYYKCIKTNEEGSTCEECLNGMILHENGTCIEDKNSTYFFNNK